MQAEPKATTEIPTRPADAAAEPAVAETKPSEGDAVIATEGVAEGKINRACLQRALLTRHVSVPEKEETKQDTAAKEEATADATPDTAEAKDDTGT